MFDVLANSISANDLVRSTINQYKDSVQSFEPNAFYMAIVENTNDSYKLGRVQIRIPAIHGTDESQAYYLPNESLPWARPAILNGAGNDMGQFIVPTKGTRLIVSFEYNDPSKPLYFGGLPTILGKTKEYNDNEEVFDGNSVEINTDDRITDLEESSAQQVIFKSFKGSTIIVNDRDGAESIKIIDAAGQQIIMENEAEVPLPRRGNKTEPPSTANIKIITNGKLDLICSDFNLNAKETNLNNYVLPDVVIDDLNFAFKNRELVKVIGDAKNTSFRISHNFNTRNVYVTVYETNSPYQEVIPNIYHTDLNNITVEFSEPPFTNQYTVAIHKMT